MQFHLQTTQYIWVHVLREDVQKAQLGLMSLQMKKVIHQIFYEPDKLQVLSKYYLMRYYFHLLFTLNLISTTWSIPTRDRRSRWLLPSPVLESTFHA